MRQPLTLILLCCLVIACLGCNDAGISYPDGGYDYPKNPADTTFYYYPLKNLFSRRDSFDRATDLFFFHLMKEPNLSIKPYGEGIFRLVYSDAIAGTTILTLSSSAIIIKRPYSANYIYIDDTSLFNKTERTLLRLLNRHFPLEDTVGTTKGFKRYKDSMIKIYPQLLDVKYYWMLEKRKLGGGDNITFKITKVAITPKDYQHLVAVINASGYWKMPFKLECEHYGTDGAGYCLEANIAKKYNYVQFGDCLLKTKEQRNFANACQQLVNYAKLGDKIGLVFDGEVPAMDTIK